MDDPSGLEKILRRRFIEATIPPPRHVLFVDILGFSNLTEAFPNPITWEFGDDNDVVASGTSEAARKLGRFQYVLDSLADSQYDGLTPTHLMLFSDCAFLVFENLLLACTCAVDLMRRFIQLQVPVRMGLAHGSWNSERFSFDSVDKLMITRSVFSGTGVVFAHKAECKGGKGLRIFIHSSIGPAALAEIAGTIQFVATAEPKPIAPFELNYLHPEPLDELAIDSDF